MSWFSKSQDHLPLTWWKGRPVYFAAVLAMGGVASMVLTAFMMAAPASVIDQLVFTFSGLVVHGRVWTVLTYVLVNPPSLWLIISCVLLWLFGEDVEKFFGRRVFARMIVIFVLAEPLLIALLALCGLGRMEALGLLQVNFAVFIAFATLYPRAQISLILLSVDAWILAAVIVAFNALEYLAARYWSGLALLAGEVGLAYGMVRYEQGRLSWALPFAWLKGLRKRRAVSASRLRVVERGRPAAPAEASASSVDAVLEKISRSGMDSLTASERRVLEKASEDLGGRGK